MQVVSTQHIMGIDRMDLKAQHNCVVSEVLKTTWGEGVVDKR